MVNKVHFDDANDFCSFNKFECELFHNISKVHHKMMLKLLLYIVNSIRFDAIKDVKEEEEEKKGKRKESQLF